MADQPGPVLDEVQPDTQSNQRRGWTGRSPVLPTVLAAICLVAFSIKEHYSGHRFSDSPGFTLPVLQIAGTALIAFLFGFPVTRREWIFTVLSQSVTLVVTALIVFGQYEITEALLLAGVFRVAILSIWILPIVGLLLTCETIRRGTLRWRPWVPAALRLCLGALFVLVCVEPTAWFLATGYLPRPITVELPPSPDEDLHVATIGGSTMLGFPYDPDWGIGRVAVAQLNRWCPKQKFVLDNIAETGVSLEKAISNINELNFMPDILVIYSGHNEAFHYLEELGAARSTAWGAVDDVLAWSPAFRLIRPTIARRTSCKFRAATRGTFFSTSPPAYIERDRLTHFRHHLRTLYQWASANDIVVIYCVPASDEATFQPIDSLCRNNDQKYNEQLRAALDRVSSLILAGEHATALTTCEAMLKSEPLCAEIHFLAGRCCRLMEQSEAARTYFTAARDLDDYTIRAQSAYTAVALAEAEQHKVPIIDCPELLRERATDGLLDDRFFLDGVHPRLQTYYVLGQAVASAIVEAGNIDFKQSEELQTQMTFAEAIQECGVTTSTLSRAYEKTSDVLLHYSDIGIQDDEQRIQAASVFARLVEGLADGSIKPGQNGCERLPDSDGD